MKSLMALTVTGILISGELFAGNIGLQLGLPLYAAVYFAVADGMVYGIISAGAAGFLLDVLYAREYLAGALIYTAIMALTANYALRSQREQPVTPFASGMICGLLICIANYIILLFAGQPYHGPNPLCMAIFQIVGGGIFMLLFTALADAVNFRSNLPQFCIRKSRNSGGRNDER